MPTTWTAVTGGTVSWSGQQGIGWFVDGWFSGHGWFGDTFTAISGSSVTWTEV